MTKFSLLALVCVFWFVPSAQASGDAPAWMHTLVNAPLPQHDEKTNAVLLYSDVSVNVISADRIRTQVREVYKILRPAGRDYGVVAVPFNPQRKIVNFHGWCIPAQGKDFEAKETAEISLPKIEGSELISDTKEKLLRIPAPDPGNIIGYEYEIEEHPLILQDEWRIEGVSPAREKHFSLHLPPGWEYKASWINHGEVKPVKAGDNQWEWAVQDMKGVREETDMPPMEGLVGMMVVTYFPPDGHTTRAFTSWKEMGDWYLDLTSGRRDASAEIKQKVAALTAGAPTQLDKMRAIAGFMQRDVRYVAIVLGIGGFQPHPASEVFTHRYGDCKDKATLMSSMLHEIGVDSYYVVINSQRGSISPDMPAHSEFDHVILAIKLPNEVSNAPLVATMQHPKLGKLLFFDPTNELTPFGEIGGYLQSNLGLLVGPQGGELVLLPQLSGVMNSVERTATFTLSPSGTLKGDVTEIRFGDRAVSQRELLRTVMKDSDRIKPIESVLAGSLSTFKILNASITNLKQNDQPFEYHYSFVSDEYAKSAGDLLVLRPRVIGSKASGLLETKEPRKFPVAFKGPVRDVDTFEITLPPGYVVDDLPPAVDADYGFASYHSRSSVVGNTLKYTRTFEIKELSVAAARADELKKFYRIIASDERNTAVLRQKTQ